MCQVMSGRSNRHLPFLIESTKAMHDVCIITEGGWPRRTGGVATWTQHVAAALAPLDVAVLSINAASAERAEWTPPPNVRVLDPIRQLRRLPPARCYVASGLEAAEQVAAMRPDVLPRLRYLEHGDLVREILAGLVYSESGRALGGADRVQAAREAAHRRRAIARTCGLVIGVTPRTLRRAAHEGARKVACIPNAVPPPAGEPLPALGAARAVGYVGRLSHEKGIDRFVALAETSSAPFIALGIPPATSCRDADASGPVAWRHHPTAPFRPELGAVVLPSRLEACPFAALEAEARGIPTLVSDVAEIEETGLLTRQRWNLELWRGQIEGMLKRGRDPVAGRAIAGRRWERFMHGWHAAVAG
jgi:glycosyltransferase involved in cell wall biosynthesis